MPQNLFSRRTPQLSLKYSGVTVGARKVGLHRCSLTTFQRAFLQETTSVDRDLPTRRGEHRYSSSMEVGVKVLTAPGSLLVSSEATGSCLPTLPVTRIPAFMIFSFAMSCRVWCYVRWRLLDCCCLVCLTRRQRNAFSLPGRS